jgi:hypothetical protein
MESLKNVVAGACMLSMAVGICSLIRPSRLLERQVRFLISLLFVASFTAPLLQMDFSGSLSELSSALRTEQTAGLEDAVEESLLSETRSRAEEALRELLSEAGISVSELSVTVHIDESDSIYLSEVNVTCGDYQKTCEVLQEALGEEVTIRVTEIIPEA